MSHNVIVVDAGKSHGDKGLGRHFLKCLIHFRCQSVKPNLIKIFLFRCLGQKPNLVGNFEDLGEMLKV